MHHALLLHGSYEWALSCLPEECRVDGPDVRHLRGTRMGIDEVRVLIREAYLTPMAGDVRVFILTYSSFTEEAQNALLKLLEEPPQTARFYIITERAGILLPTLRSRLILDQTEEVGGSRFDFASFLKLSHGERIAQIGDRAKNKDDTWLTSLMEAFESWAHEKREPSFMRAFLELKPLFHTSGASKKMILEHLSLLTP